MRWSRIRTIPCATPAPRGRTSSSGCSSRRTTSTITSSIICCSTYPATTCRAFTAYSVKAGMRIAAGDMIHPFMAIVGISAVFATSALLFSIIKYVGAAYLIYLGIRAILERTPANLTAGALPISAGKAFRQAILAEVLNPKTALFFLAFFPQFVAPENGSVMLQLTILGILFVLLGLVSTVVFAVCAGGLGKFLRRNPTVLKWQGKAVGGIYCAL